MPRPIPQGAWWYRFPRCFSSSSAALPQIPNISSETHHLLSNVRALSARGILKEALSLFYKAQVPVPSLCFAEQTYATLFHACARHGFLREGVDLHRHMLSNNPDHRPGVFVTNHLINMYVKCGDIETARELFEEMPERNVVSWTALVSGYAQHGRTHECFSLFSDMLRDCCPNEFSFASVFSCCGYEQGKQVHALALKMGLDGSIYVGNALITWYSRSNDCNVACSGGRDEAWSVFETMSMRNVVTWNCMISGFQSRKLGVQGLGLFGQMYGEGIGFDRATMVSVFSCLSGSYGDKVDIGLEYCVQLHCLSIKSGFVSQIEVATALVKAYSDLGGDVANCYQLFVEGSCHRDVVSWTGIITAFAEREPEKALFLFRQLCREGLAPDKYTYSSALKACAGLVTERHALGVHSQVIKDGFDSDPVLSNALIHAYARCGTISLSKQVFDEMKFRDPVSWNSMLKAFALHGQAKEALHLFAVMNVQPDSATMVALLSACSHGGLVEEGLKIFDSMTTDYGIFPKIEHFACVVDILGRAGRVFEAKEFISKMPIEPDSVVWSALLGSCRKHGQMELARLAAEKMKELVPANSLGYVQMSNMYCSGGSFHEAGLVRKEMDGSSVRKEPALSWIEVGNAVHEFASGGRRHPQRQAIFSKLHVLIGLLKESGYVPETSLALRDIEEEYKEEQLYHHSEKLALVFAIMNEGSLHGGGSVIRIMKNIRICVDCHNFMKLASGVLQKEIVVRDSNRFHHFKNKACSCNDYW